MTSSSHENIVLYGGQGDIFASLNRSAEAMPYLMLETSEYGIEFGYSRDYDFVRNLLILRLHAFGSGGDLMIRRDEDRIFWRFVGYERVFNQLGLTDGTSYPEKLCISHKGERSLLWGAFDERLGYWQENRVGKAQLTYPFPKPVERVEIHACRVLDVSTRETVAYWTYTLAAHQPQESK